MSKLSLREIAQSQLDSTPVIDGQLIVCLDTGNAYRDTATAHVKIGSDLEVVSDLPLAPLAEKLYYLKPDKLYVFLGGNWTLLNDKTIDLDKAIAKLPAGSSTALNDDVEIITQDTDTTQSHYYRRKLVVLWEYIKTKAQDFFAAKNHKHVKADITDFPTSMPASDVYPWAKAATKPSYTKAEVGLGKVDNTADADKTVKRATTAGTADSANSVMWENVKNKPTTFPAEAHTHDDRYYTEAEVNSKLSGKVDNTEAGANGLINKLSTADGVPNDTTVFISQHNDGKTASYYRRPISTLWTYIKSKADSVYQPKGSYAASNHTHDDRYYTESEVNGKLGSKVDNTETGANGLLSKLAVWTATPTDDTYFMRQDTSGGNSFGRVKFSTLWNYIKGKADGTYQPKGNYSTTDTKNTAGSTNTTSKLYLIGATSQSANPQTYSNASVYTTGGALAADGIGKDGYIAYPGGGFFITKNSTITGYCKIILPVGYTNTMMSFTVTIYDHVSNESVDYKISGYNYNTDKAWHNPTAVCVGKAGASHSNLTVRFGDNGSNVAITIGESTTRWNYPQVVVHDVLLGFNDYEFNGFKSGWSIVFDKQDISNVSQTISNTHVGYDAVTSWDKIQNKPSSFTPASHTHTKDQVGLSNVDNTADKDKNVATARGISVGDPVLATGVEYSEITGKINDNKSLGITAANVGVFGLRNALDFRWYDTHWQIGNLRSGSTLSAGFGFAFKDEGESSFSLKARILTDGTYTGNISGNASTATVATTANSLNYFKCTSSSNVGIDDTSANAIGYVDGISLLGQGDGALYKQVYNNAWVHEIYGDYRTGQIALRGKNNGTWQGWRTVLDSSNYSSYALPRSGGTISGTLHINPGNIGNYVEGIRIHSSTDGWTTLMLCGPDNVGDVGTSAKSWSFHTNNGEFALGKNGAAIDGNSSTASLTCKSDNIWRVNNTPILTTAGGTLSGNIHFADIGNVGTSSGITWGGSTDGAGIYYQTTGADQGNLVLNLTDDYNCYLRIAQNGNFKSYFSPNDGNFHGNVNGTADVANVANFAKETYINQYKTVNLTDLDQNTWYPVTTYIPYKGLRRFKCNVQLNSGSKPSWSTHNSGFTAVVDILEESSGWGTTTMQGMVLVNDQYWINDSNKPPVGYSQLGNSSIAVWWLRGGGTYFLAADYDCTWTIQKSKYEIKGQSVAPTTTYPGVSVRRSTIVANLDGHANTSEVATVGVRDYNNANNIIKIGWSGADLDANTLSYVAGYTSDMKIHTASKDGVRSWLGLGASAYKKVQSLSAVGHSDWQNQSTDDGYVPTMAFMAFWNGAFSSSGSSNLQYCDRGRFGTIITKSSEDYAVAGHTHNSVNDIGNGGTTTFAYSKNGMNYGDYTWLAGWNGYELRAVDKNQFAIKSGSNDYVRVYNSNNVGCSGSVTLNDLAKQHYAMAMIYDATDNPLGKAAWVHAISMAWTNNDNSNWVSQIALGVQDSYGMWFRTGQGAITGRAWNRVYDSSYHPNADYATKANSADYLNFTAGNEINFTGTPQNNTVYFGYRNTSINEYKFNNGNGGGGLASITAAAFNGKATSAGTADSATTSNGVKDYNDGNRTIQIGYAGSGLNTSNLTHIAGYTDNGTKIKDVSKDVLTSWIGLGNYLPLSGGAMSGQIVKSTDGSWIGDRDRAAIRSWAPGGSAYGAVAAMGTRNGCWTMGALGDWEDLVFNYSTDSNYNAGKNETSQVRLPAQAGTIITSATIGNQGVNRAEYLGNDSAYMRMHWNGQSGQPTWLWGGNDASNMYVYNPSNFSVNYANSAGNGVNSYSVNTSGCKGYIRFNNGVQICWDTTTSVTASGSFTFPQSFKYAPCIMLSGTGAYRYAFYVTEENATSFKYDRDGDYNMVSPQYLAVGRWA